jgi:pseudouridine-5'-phosphate glycosidase
VALETTLVTHGLPRPQGLEAALALNPAYVPALANLANLAGFRPTASA